MAARRRPWAKLEESRRLAATYPLDILVWGPAKSNSIEYRKRVEIRDALRLAGHHADFSEELVDPGQSDDPLDDELLQADAAQLIVVIYGSRGTQTEVDRLLVHPQFAEKALVFITPDTLAAVRESVSKGTWEKLERIGQVEQYTTADLEACLVVGRACAVAQKLRRAAFVKTVVER